MIDTLAKELLAQSSWEFRAIVRPAALLPHYLANLDDNLEPESPSLRHRRSAIHSAGFALDSSLSWQGCPGFMNLPEQVDDCPLRPIATIAVSLPQVESASELTQAEHGTRPAHANADGLRVRTITTFRQRNGAHTRFLDLILRWNGSKWQVVRKEFIGYLEH